MEALAKFEGHAKQEVVAAQGVSNNYKRHIAAKSELGGSISLASEAVKSTGTVVGGVLGAYALDFILANYVDGAIPSLTGLTKPSSIAKIIGTFGAPIYAAYRKKASARNREIATGIAAYYIPQLINLARTMVAAPVRLPRPVPIPVALATPTGFHAARSNMF